MLRYGGGTSTVWMQSAAASLCLYMYVLENDISNYRPVDLAIAHGHHAVRRTLWASRSLFRWRRRQITRHQCLDLFLKEIVTQKEESLWS